MQPEINTESFPAMVMKSSRPCPLLCRFLSLVRARVSVGLSFSRLRSIVRFFFRPTLNRRVPSASFFHKFPRLFSLSGPNLNFPRVAGSRPTSLSVPPLTILFRRSISSPCFARCYVASESHGLSIKVGSFLSSAVAIEGPTEMTLSLFPLVLNEEANVTSDARSISTFSSSSSSLPLSLFLPLTRRYYSRLELDFMALAFSTAIKFIRRLFR